MLKGAGILAALPLVAGHAGEALAQDANNGWEDGIKKLGLHGGSIGCVCAGEELSARKFDPFWAKANELGVIVVMHPGGADNIAIAPPSFGADAGALLLARERAFSGNRVVRLANVRGTVDEVLRIANFQKLFDIR